MRGKVSIEEVRVKIDVVEKKVKGAELRIAESVCDQHNGGFNKNIVGSKKI